MPGSTKQKESRSGRRSSASAEASHGSVATHVPSSSTQAQISAVAWTPREDLDREAWETAGRKLGAVGRGSQWWIGDWIRYGNARWGEKYAEASELTGYDVGSLRNMAWVSSQFELSLRSDKLTWSHHAILAPLDDEEKREWIERAESERLAVNKLRSEVQAAISAPATEPEDAEEETAPTSTVMTCPNCGHQIDEVD